MNFSINEVDQVIERTNCSYEEAKQALTETNGDVLDAIILLEKKANEPVFGSKFKEFVDEGERTADSIINKISEAIKEGSVTKIAIRDKDGKTLTSLSVNSTLAIGGIGLVLGAAPVMVIGALVARYGLNCQFVIIDKDGNERII